MRIAFVSTDPGIPVLGSKGASVHEQSVIRVLLDAGHEVHVLTPRPGPADHPLAARIHLHELPAVRGKAATEREASARASDRAIGTLLDRIDPALVYERYALWGHSAMTWAAARRIPSVLEVNAPLIEEQRTHRELAGEAAARAVARDALGAAGGVVCVSRAVADWAVAHGADTARTRVLANGVDTERIRPRTHRPANVPFTVGFLGTLKPWHGLEVLLEALRTVPDARLLVVGDGPRREDCERRATAYGLDAEFVGAVAPDEVGAQLQRMDVACAPYPDAPGHYFSPLKVFEYLAAGLPVVASRIGQIPELLDRGDSGLLVTPGDPHDLARALRELQTDPARRERLGAAARESALDRHTWRGVVEQALDLVGLPLEASAQVQAS